MSASEISPAAREARHASARGDAEIEAIVASIIGQVADKWTMITLETLVQQGRCRFSTLSGLIGGISQKMLTQTLRQMEELGLLTRTVYPVVPPHVEYELTELGDSLGAAFCGVWKWAERHREAIASAQAAFRARPAENPGIHRL
jgi:DNA-binding HxlR family transcriptional regulator